MKYRVFALMGAIALGAGAMLQAQDYDDIYYDASKPATSQASKAKTAEPAKTIAVYGNVPERYEAVARSNYRVERDEDEYNRRGTQQYQPQFEVDINGDTIYFDNDSIYDEDAFANTRLIERFYNPDIVVLSSDDELVELYYNETPTINLIIGSDWGYSSYGWYSSYYYDPWYSGWYYPWHGCNYWYRWYDPWYSPFYYTGYASPYWHWGWHYSPWYRTGWGWDYAWHNNWVPSHDRWRPSTGRHSWNTGSTTGHRVGLADNRNARTRVGLDTGSRSGIAPRGNNGNRPTGVGSRPSTATTRGGGNMGTRRSSGVTTRSSSGTSGVRSSSTGTRSYDGGSRSSYGGSRSSGSSYGGSRSSGSSYGGSRSSGSSTRSSGGSYGGSRGGYSGGGSSHGGSSGGGTRRR